MMEPFTRVVGQDWRERGGDAPLCRRLEAALRAAIAEGRLAAGAPLPSERAMAAGLSLHAGWRADSLLLSALALAPALLGMWLGQRIRSRLSPQRFRQGFLLFLLALGIELIARGWLV